MQRGDILFFEEKFLYFSLIQNQSEFELIYFKEFAIE